MDYSDDFKSRYANDSEKRSEQEFVQRQLESARKTAVLKFLTKEARERLSNVKIARPEVAEAIETGILNAVQTGSIKEPITDEKLREILEQVSAKRDFKIIK
ncbi:MAG TPA: DNA-binding protein [Candidatus Nanoarchaeia archaeon]|nr:DNA-binding protein [Candidatus Nanoarchaeia archaeon]